jgi:hypothetical protein
MNPRLNKPRLNKPRLNKPRLFLQRLGPLVKASARLDRG